MTDLDRRVAELRGWTFDRIKGWIFRGVSVAGHNYSPKTNLLQAYQLWDEAKPEGWMLTVYQTRQNGWYVARATAGKPTVVDETDIADLPRAITEAWVEAREGK